ncbi:MAG: DUF2207 domain-containing protein [Gemmatimonadales bacterium]
MRRFAFLLTILLAATPLAAQERILSYDSEIDVRKDASIDVTERITVRAEGQQIRRGIYRDFPTRYRDRFGNRVRVDLQVLGVERNGNTEPWFTERMSNGIRINTGDDSFLTVPAEYTYTIRYRTTRQLGFFADHDELYWNAIGTGWIFPIERGSVEVRLSAPVPIDKMHAEAYTGPQGAKGADYVAEFPAPGVARYRLTRPLGPQEGFTIVLSFPKGLVHEPTQSERLQWFLKDNRGVLVALAGLILLLFYTVTQWRRVGRDPQKGVVIARYEPRDGQTPAGLRFLQRMGYDMRCFTADILALAVGGHVGINHEDKFLKDEWRLDRTSSPSSTTPSPAQERLLDLIFGGGKESLVLKNTNAARISSAREAHRKALDGEFQPRYFKRNARKVAIAWLIAIATGVVAFITSGGFGIPAIIAVSFLMLVTLIVFTRLIRAPTLEGRALLDEIEGLKLYMSVAERQELASMRGPDEPVLDAKRYEAMLPYAVALDVEDAWTEKFTVAAGAAAAAAAASNMTWYSGRGSFSNLGDFSSAIGSSLSSSISSASNPPGSSSGGGGGGSSGGGGGGGGGGGR